jgi:hypothetical protein
MVTHRGACIHIKVHIHTYITKTYTDVYNTNTHLSSTASRSLAGMVTHGTVRREGAVSAPSPPLLPRLLVKEGRSMCELAYWVHDDDPLRHVRKRLSHSLSEARGGIDGRSRGVMLKVSTEVAGIHSMANRSYSCISPDPSHIITIDR